MMARVAADGSRWPGTRAHSALAGSPGTVRPGGELLEGQALGQPHVDEVEDGGGREARDPTGRALVGRGHLGGGDPHAAGVEPARGDRRRR